MKKAGDIIRVGGTWFEIIFRAEFRQFAPVLVVGEGSVGFARRNRKQTGYLDVIAPPKNSPEQAAAFYLSEQEANQLLLAGKPAPAESGDLNALWLKCWENTIQRKLL